MRKVLQKIRPDKRIIIGYSVSLFLLLVTYLAIVLTNDRLRQRTELVDHTYNVIYDLELLLSTVKDGETGVRGYALTRDLAFLEPFYHSRQKADSLRILLKGLLTDQRPQLERLEELRGLLDKRFSLFDEGVIFYENGGVDKNYNFAIKSQLAKTLMKRIRLTVDIMQKEERYQLADRDRELKNMFSYVQTITLGSLLLTIILMIIGFMTYTKENRARRTAMHNLKEYQRQLSTRIRELRTANEQLVQIRSMEKFAATGRIARTIAHEVRNPLTNINLATSQLKSDLPGDDENLSYLFGIIDRNSNRINNLISDLLQTTKFAELNFQKVYVNDLLDESIALAKDRIELNHVKILKEYSTSCNVYVDPDKIKIAFLNIIINAIEAMEGREAELKIASRSEDQKCVITITDNGVGMDDGALSKLFEPYFTSKPMGNGLGLANTQNIIFNHKGSISVQSEMGKGTSFMIQLDIV